jgi:hypothetical protein
LDTLMGMVKTGLPWTSAGEAIATAASRR